MSSVDSDPLIPLPLMRSADDVDGRAGKVRRALCPGSFDPVTNGHLEFIVQAASLYDEVIVAVAISDSKPGTFSVDERRSMLVESLADYPNVEVDTFRGLTVDYCHEHDIPVIIKGLRSMSDFDYELQQAQMNRSLAGVTTLFMPTSPDSGFLASSRVKEIAKLGGDASALVPSAAFRKLGAHG